eukprot:1924971-Pyramimonas_sp.AAC.1
MPRRGGTAPFRGGVRGAPARHAAMETRALPCGLARAAYAPMSAQTTPSASVARVSDSGRRRGCTPPLHKSCQAPRKTPPCTTRA